MAADGRADASLGPVGDRVIFENESIRVWRLSVPPGETKGMHRHELPYLVVPLSGGRVEVTTAEGEVRTPEDRPGTAVWHEAGEIHQLRNLSAASYENVLVELKRHDPAP